MTASWMKSLHIYTLIVSFQTRRIIYTEHQDVTGTLFPVQANSSATDPRANNWARKTNKNKQTRCLWTRLQPGVTVLGKSLVLIMKDEWSLNTDGMNVLGQWTHRTGSRTMSFIHSNSGRLRGTFPRMVEEPVNDPRWPFFRDQDTSKN